MNLNQGISIEALLVLDAIATRGSFAAAAEALDKVPSALSYVVQKLEEQLEVTLFVKQGRRSVLTPAGRYLLDEGRKVLSAVQQLKSQTQTIANGWEPKLNIAVDSIVNIDVFYKKLSKFLNEHPTVEINLFEEVMKGGWEALIKDQVDLVVGAPEPAPNHQGLSVRPFCKLENVLAAAPHHALVKSNKVLNENTLKGFRTVIVKDSVKTDIARSTNVIEKSQHLYVQTVAQKIKAIEAGLGIGFLPIERITNQLEQGRLVELETEIEVTNVNLTLAWKTANRGKGLKKLVELLLND